MIWKTEAAAGDILRKKVFLKNSEFLQENTCVRFSGIGVSLNNIFREDCFYRRLFLNFPLKSNFFLNNFFYSLFQYVYFADCCRS